MTSLLIVLIVLAIQMFYVIRELQKANVLAQQAITSQLAIAEKLARIEEKT